MSSIALFAYLFTACIRFYTKCKLHVQMNVQHQKGVVSCVFSNFFLVNMQLQSANHGHPLNKLHKFTKNDILTD